MQDTVFAIDGRVISKKNSKQWVVRGGRRFLIPSQSFDKFRISAITQLMQHFKFRAPRISSKVYVAVHFYLKGNVDIDIDNAFTSILDILQDKSFPIITNDKNVMSAHQEKTLNEAYFHTRIVVKTMGEGGEMI